METSAPLVTIAIPTYNRASGYLKEALESALQQTYPNVEIIVSDNGSTDNTEAVVRSYTDPRLRYIRHEKSIGANGNFNFCLEQARGEFFLLLHDDDRIDPDFVESCLKAANYRTDVGLIRTGTRIIDAEGKVVAAHQNRGGGLSAEDYFRAWFAKKSAWYFCSTLFNTQKLRAIGGFFSKHQLLQDGVAIVLLASQHERADVQAPKASFRHHGGKMALAAKVGHWAEEFVELLDLICEASPVEKRAQLRKEGISFFSKSSYRRASEVASPFQRLVAYLTVFKTFRYRRFPPFLTRPVRRILVRLHLLRSSPSWSA